MILLRTSQLEDILAHARQAQPSECCGLVGGAEDGRTQSIYRLRNIASNPEVAYEAAPDELFAAQRLMREREERLLAIYHSHPRSIVPSPSETDVRLAYYPSATYLIAGLAGSNPVVKAFQISEQEQRWQEVEYEIVDE
jgi:proteasome lid subunit RPN8/RPN11